MAYKILKIRHRRETLKRRIKQFNTYFPTYKTKTTERWKRHGQP